MISPPLTVWPANTLTPSIFGLESRPLRLEPSPFLCAICGLLLLGGARGRSVGGSCGRRLCSGGRLAGEHLHVGDLEPGELGAMAGAPAVALLGAVLEDAQLRPPLVRRDLGLDLHLLEVLAHDHLLVAEGDRPEVDPVALLRGQTVDEQGRALLDAVLLAACLDHCVAGHVDSMPLGLVLARAGAPPAASGASTPAPAGARGF